MRRLKVLGITTFMPKYFRGQARYVAAVSSQKEFAKLLDTSLYFIRGYSSVTHNDEEVKIATKNPHKLVLISVIDVGMPGDRKIMRVCE